MQACSGEVHERKARHGTDNCLRGPIRKHCELIVAVSYRDQANFENMTSVVNDDGGDEAHLPSRWI